MDSAEQFQDRVVRECIAAGAPASVDGVSRITGISPNGVRDSFARIESNPCVACGGRGYAGFLVCVFCGGSGRLNQPA